MLVYAAYLQCNFFQVDMNAFAHVSGEGPPIKIVQSSLPDSSSILHGELNVPGLNENNQMLYELITQGSPQQQKLAVSMHTPEQGAAATAAQVAQMVMTTTMTPQVSDQNVGTQAILVQDAQALQGLPADLHQIITKETTFYNF